MSFYLLNWRTFAQNKLIDVSERLVIVIKMVQCAPKCNQERQNVAAKNDQMN